MPYIIAEIVAGVLIVLFIVIRLISRIIEYEKSEYRKQTGSSYFEMMEDSGIKGEYKVSKIIGETNNTDKYVLHGLMLKFGNGKTEIDHIVIQPNGIFVIETKNLSGSIHGKEEEQHWSQVLGNGDIRHEFYNPIRQNRTHTQFLSRILKNEHVVFPYVCFVKAELIPDIKGIGSLSDLARFLQSDTGLRLSQSEMKSFYDRILKCKGSDEDKEEHIKRIREKHRDNTKH